MLGNISGQYDVPDKTHASPKEAFITVHVLRDCSQKLKYGLDVVLQNRGCERDQ